MNLSNIKIATLNVRGLAEAADEVAATVIDAGRADIVVVTETKLRPDSAYPNRHVVMVSAQPMTDEELSKPRVGSGGVAVMTHPSWRDRVRPVEVDQAGRFITFTADDWVVCGMYLQPSGQLGSEGVQEALAGLERATRLHPGKPVLWCGDVNGRHAELLGDRETSTRGRLLARDALARLGLRLINPVGRPTFYQVRNNVPPAEWRRSTLDWMAANQAG